MNHVNLGRTGLRVSRVCLGMMSYGQHESRPWTLPEQDAEPIVRAAIEDALAAERLALSREEMARLEEPYVPHAVAGHG